MATQPIKKKKLVLNNFIYLESYREASKNKIRRRSAEKTNPTSYH
jgi:hypothetical protein